MRISREKNSAKSCFFIDFLKNLFRHLRCYEFASKVLEAIQKDGKVKTAILDLVCACPNIVTEL